MDIRITNKSNLDIKEALRYILLLELHDVKSIEMGNIVVVKYQNTNEIIYTINKK